MRMLLSMVLLAVLLAGCDGFGSLTDKEYVARAQDYLDRGEIKAASIELKNALTQNPKNPQARWLLGRLYVDIGNYPGAEKELLKARELGVVEQSVLPLLAKAYLRQSAYDKVLELEDKPGFPKRARASLLASRAIAHLMQGDMDQAADVVGQALQNDPKLPYALLARASLEVFRKQPAAARKTLDEIIRIAPDYAPAWSVIGDLDRQEGNLEAAEQAFGKAVENRFVNTADRLKRALVRIQLRKFDAAQKDLDLLKKLLPKNSGVNYAQGLSYFLQRNYSAAQEALERSLQADQAYPPALFFIGAAHYAQNHTEQADDYLSRFVRLRPDFMPGRKLLAALKLKQRQYQQVVSLLNPVLRAQQDDVLALNLLASALIRQGKTEQGIQLLQRVVALEPDSATARARLGFGLMLGGKRQAGADTLENALELDPKLKQVDMLLVLNYLRQKKFSEAEQAARAFRERQPESVMPYNLLGIALAGQNRKEEARAAFEAALKLVPGDPTASQNLAALAIRENKPEQARKIYQEVLKHRPDDLATLIRLAALDAERGDRAAMTRTLARAVTAHADAALPKILLARSYLLAGKPQKAREVLGELERQETSPVILELIGQIQLAEDNFPAAVDSFSRLVARTPKSAQAHFLLAKAYAGRGDDGLMRQELSRALKLAPDHFLANLTQARLDLKDGNLARVEQRLKRLKKIAAEHSDVLALEAAVSAEKGAVEQSASLLEQRFRKRPITRHLLDLAKLKLQQGRTGEAVAMLDEWLQQHPDDIQVRTLLAAAYLRQGAQQQAIAQYQAILEYDENNLAALNDLAWQLRKQDPDLALSYARKAQTLAPESAPVLDTLAAVLVENGDLAEAERLNRQALRQQPDTPSFRFRKAEIFAAMGRREEARDLLRELLSGKQAFAERTAAEDLLKRLQQGG